MDDILTMEAILTAVDDQAADDSAQLDLPASTVELVQTLRNVVGNDFYGMDPHFVSPPYPNWEPFNPGYIAILYLQLVNGWELAVNHACFTADAPNTEDSRRAKAVAILEKKIADGVTFGELDPQLFGTYRHQLANAGHDPARPYDSGWFNDFNFLSQNELFIYIDDPDIRLEPGDLIAFKAYGIGPHPKHANFAYFHAREVPQQAMGALTGKMIRVENYATKQDGTLIGAADNRYYSMDIKFRIDGDTAGMITMIIDPDTGNGTGNEP